MGWRRTEMRPDHRFVRAAGVAVLAVALAGATAFLLLPLAVRGFVRGIELVMAGTVWLAMSISVGVSIWTVLGAVGRAAAAALMTRQASAVLAGLVLVAAIALWGLQRLLGSEEESSR